MNKVCAIVPTYNNGHTVADIVSRLLQQGLTVVVVDDGSTDNTADALRAFGSDIHCVSHTPNRGKGYALCRGFEQARTLGFSHALTVDADGQHYPEDAHLLLRASEQDPRAIITGSRNLSAPGMPEANTFANRFSNFWFRLQTGIALPDTQTGFRLYPLASLPKLRYITHRYESELQLMVYAAWNGVPITPVGVRVCYPDDRVSHFRPFADFARISLLNTMLTFLAVVYGRPHRRWMLHKSRKTT